MESTKALIKKYLEGKCNTEESVLVEKFIANNPNIIDGLFPKEEWDNIDCSKPIPNKDLVFNGIKAIMYRQQKTRKIFRIGVQAVACFILFIVVSHIYKYFQGPTFVVQDTLANNEMLADSAVTNLYYINSDNKPMQILASDGSQITLYPGSEVRFAENFGYTSERIIELKGKAQFEVAKDKKKPFRVISNGLVTSALGTIFIVDELTTNETKVDLLEGSIEVATIKPHKKSFKRIIQPNESLSVDHQAAIILEEVKASRVKSVRACFYVQNSQNIIIKNLALEDIFRNLEQNFGVDISYDKSLINNKYFSGTFKYSKAVYLKIIEEINYLHKTNVIVE